MASHVLNEIFDKLHSADKDFRFMATSDLLAELQKDTLRLDSDTERRVCHVVLQKMQDIAGEISEIAVKCLSVLLPKIHHDSNLQEILRLLLDSFLSEKKEHEGRETANLGLKTVIETIPAHSPSGTTVINALTPRLIQGMESKSDEVVLMSLDIASEYVIKYGSVLESSGEALLRVFLQLLHESRSITRKKAISCMGVLSLSLPDAKLHDLVSLLLETIQRPNLAPQLVTSHVQAIGVVCYVVGNRVGQHIETGVAAVLTLIQEASQDDVELLESCLHALESFVSRTALFARPHLNAILETCLKLIHFDPNYADDVEVSEDEEMQSEEEEEDIYSDEEAYSDDEDESWKVRKASASCLTSIFASNAEQIHQIYPQVGPVLIARFSEREENVKLDVLAAYISLLHHVRRSYKTYGGFDVTSLLEPSVPSLMKMIGRQLREKSVKTRLHVFKVLKEVAVVLPGHISSSMQNLTAPITKALKETAGASSELKIEVLSFLRVAMAKSEAIEFQFSLPVLAPAVFEAVKERYFKVTSEALRACNAMVHILRPTSDTLIDDALAGLIPQLSAAVMYRLRAQDVDQEVKEYAIQCIADVLAMLGDQLSDEVELVMQVLLERLKSETTRLTCVKALSVIGASPLELDLSQVLTPIVTELTVFLKKANVTLRQTALHALDVFCQRSGALLSVDVVEGIIREAAALIGEQDLHLASNSLDLLSTVAQKAPSAKPMLNSTVVPRALALVQSPLLQGSALASLQRFFVAMADHFEELFGELMAEKSGKVQQLSTACCVAALCCHGNAALLPGTVQTLLRAATQAKSEPTKRLALLSLGEIGRLTSLSSYPQVETLLTQALQDASEDVKSAASYALGALTLGNLEQYLPGLVVKICQSCGQQKQLYQLLQALNEVIGSLNHSKTTSPISQEHVVEIRDMLLSSEDFEEECRGVAAECLGHLTLLYPEIMLPSLKSHISSSSENIRFMIIAGLRYAIVDQPHAVDAALHEDLELYLQSLTDSSRHVRKAAVQLLTSVLAHKYRLVQDSLQAILPKLYAQTEKRQDMIRVLDFGPFKHQIDDGIEIRKATFECLDLLLDVALSRINIQEFMLHLQKGLADEKDIKLQCYPMLIKLCSLAQEEVLSAVDRLVEPLQKTLTRTVPTDAVKHERERHMELVTSCLRAVDALNTMEGIASQKSFKRMMDSVVNRGDMKTTFQQIQKERSEAQEEQKTSREQASLFTVLNRGLSGSMSL